MLCLVQRQTQGSRPTSVVRYDAHLTALGRPPVIMQRIPVALQRLTSVAEAAHLQPATLMSLTQLATFNWPAALQQQSGGCWHHMRPSRVGVACCLSVYDALHTFTDVVHMQAFSGSSHVQGLQDFFDVPRKEKEELTTGQLLIVH